MAYFSDEFQEGLRTKLHEIYYEHETNRTIEVRCGLHHTCNRFSLLEGGQLPFVHCEIIFPEEFSAESVYRQFKRIVKCLMGDANLIVYPEDSKGSSTSHRLFIVSTDDFKPSLEKSSSIVTEAETELSMVFEASMQLNRFGDLTRTAAVCIRVLLCTYIRCNGSHSDLARNQNWKALLSSTNRSLSRKIKGEDAIKLRESQISLMNASILTSTSSERQERAINPREYPSPSNGNGKRQRSPDNDNAGRVAARAVQPRSGADGDTLAQGFNGSLPQSCEGDLLQGSPLKFDGLQDDDISPRSPVRQKMVPAGDGSGDTSVQNALDGGVFDGSPDSILPCREIPTEDFLPGFNGQPKRPDALDASRQISTGHPQDKLCRLVRTCSSMLLQAHALGLLSIDKRAMLVHITHESLKKDLKAVCEKKNDEMTAVSTLAGMRRRRVSES